jgi:FkbM family methyltransferase
VPTQVVIQHQQHRVSSQHITVGQGAWRAECVASEGAPLFDTLNRLPVSAIAKIRRGSAPKNADQDGAECRRSTTTLGTVLLYFCALMFRSILKTASRGVVLKRYLPSEFGGTPLFVSPESALSYWKRDISKVDPFLLSMVRQLVRPEMTVWDIGANVGLFSFAAASLGARVVAVEPDLWLASLIQRSAMLNKLPVTVLPAAVADSEGISKLFLSDEGRSSNSLAGSGSFQTVVTVTLDWMRKYLDAPQLVKIDVEGFEYTALKGAANLLQSSRPQISCEVTEKREQGRTPERSGLRTLRRSRGESSPVEHSIPGHAGDSEEGWGDKGAEFSGQSIADRI